MEAKNSREGILGKEKQFTFIEHDSVTRKRKRKIERYIFIVYD